MGELISRSALIEVLKSEKKQDRSRVYGEHECDLIAGTIAMIIDFVKAMPTAYDVEKVVEELENMKLIRVEQCHEDYEIEVMTESNFDDAISIVKAGGVE